MLLFVYSNLKTIISLCLVIFLKNQDAIIITLETIITSSIALLSANIHFTTVTNIQFLSILVYILVILIRTTTSSLASIQIQAPFLSILYIFFLCCMLVALSAGQYLVSN